MPPVRFPDWLVAIDGDSVPAEETRFELPAQPIAERLASLRARGHAEVSLTFATDQGPKTITRALRLRGADEALFYFGLYALVALFALWSGLAVVVLARRRAGAYAYAAWSVGTFVFMVTFYDYHSAAWLAPLFTLSTMCFPLCVVWLAYSFPEPPRARRRALRGVVIAFTACGVVAAGVLALGPYLSFPRRLDLRHLRLAVGPIALSSLLVLSISILYRLRVERGRRRQELRSSALGLAAVPALMAIGFLMTFATGTSIIHILLPFLVQLMPLSVGYALIRHNVFETQSVLSRRMFVVPVLTVALVVAIIAWLALRAALRTEGSIAVVPWVERSGGTGVAGPGGFPRRRPAVFPRRPAFARPCSSSPTIWRRREPPPTSGAPSKPRSCAGCRQTAPRCWRPPISTGCRTARRA